MQLYPLRYCLFGPSACHILPQPFKYCCTQFMMPGCIAMQDKGLRKSIFTHIVRDIAHMNQKSKNQKVTLSG